jgi:hypothetical protein
LKAFKAKFVEHIEHNFDTLLAKAHAEHRSAKPHAPAKDRARTDAGVKKGAPKTVRKTARKRSA